jgi:hypothetical protein
MGVARDMDAARAAAKRALVLAGTPEDRAERQLQRAMPSTPAARV